MKKITRRSFITIAGAVAAAAALTACGAASESAPAAVSSAPASSAASVAAESAASSAASESAASAAADGAVTVADGEEMFNYLVDYAHENGPAVLQMSATPEAYKTATSSGEMYLLFDVDNTESYVNPDSAYLVRIYDATSGELSENMVSGATAEELMESCKAAGWVSEDGVVNTEKIVEDTRATRDAFITDVTGKRSDIKAPTLVTE